MTLFKDDYRKQFEDVAPSPALQQETLALMAEAQAHGLNAPPAPKSKKPLILSLSLSGAAAMLALTVGLSFWLSRPGEILPDQAGDLSSVLAGNSTAQTDKSESSGASSDADTTLKGEDAAPESTDDGTNSGGDENAGSTGASGSASPEDAPEDENPSISENYNTSDGSDSDAPAPDLLGPIIVEDKNTETYLSIQAYLDALTAKKTVGYGSNYMAEPALVIVPSYLPQQVQFRHLYAKSNGAYSYSYLLTDGENQYFLDISAPATFPRTQRDLNLRVRAVKGEYEGMDKVENKRIYYFGNYEEITVTLTTASGGAPTAEETDRLLADLQLDRYTPQNTLVQLEYPS